MSKSMIQDLCRQLRLGTHIANVYTQIEAASHEAYLIRILEEAVAARESERQKRYIQQAGFDLMKGIETFDFRDINLPVQLTAEALKSCAFVSHKQNLIHYGPPGTGKTHLAIALGIEACKRGHRVMYYKTSRLVNALSQAKAKGTEERFWKKLDAVDLLILDEWGFIPFERTGTQLLFEAIAACYEKRSVIVTTNLPFDEWNTIFYDQKLTAAILDRLIHHGLLINHVGMSYRLTYTQMQ